MIDPSDIVRSFAIGPQGAVYALESGGTLVNLNAGGNADVRVVIDPSVVVRAFAVGPQGAVYALESGGTLVNLNAGGNADQRVVIDPNFVVRSFAVGPAGVGLRSGIRRDASQPECGGNANDRDVVATGVSSFTVAPNGGIMLTAPTISAGNSVYGQPVVVTATITAAGPGTPTPTGGTMCFWEVTPGGDTLVGMATLDANGQAFLTMWCRPIGTHLIYATYGNDPPPVFADSGAPAVASTVAQVSTTSAVSLSTSRSVYGEAVTVTATVASNGGLGSLAPTGSVTFWGGPVGGTALATVQLTNGQASLTMRARRW